MKTPTALKTKQEKSTASTTQDALPPKDLMQVGVIGLGTMGRNFLLNITDHGFGGAGYDKSVKAVKTTQDLSEDRRLYATADLKAFVNALQRPRAMVLLVPAPVVDHVLTDLIPLLSPGDIVVDGGNSNFAETEWRERTLAAQEIHFIGMGISGGEEGARHGPSMMPGGFKDAYERLRPILEATSAHVDGDPCVAYLGPRGAGHYVKMVHNGIEYGIMQLIAEAYNLLKQGAGLTDPELATLFVEWNRGDLNSYLLEITADIFAQCDSETDNWLVDMILDEADQLGTGMWTSQEALKLGVPIPTIDAGVWSRFISHSGQERDQAATKYTRPKAQLDRAQIAEPLRRALHTAMILTYAQGFSLLHFASKEHDYGLDLATVARIWRGGCIIRSAMLEPFRRAFADQPDLPNLLLEDDLAQQVDDGMSSLRTVVAAAASAGIPAPGLMSALAYLESYRSAWLPANLIQAQRDYFGAHTYRRIDEAGVFHTDWEDDDAHD